jgi:hypothetical protein
LSYISVVNVHGPTENINAAKDRLCRELQHVPVTFLTHQMRVFLGDFNAQVGREETFVRTNRNESLHEINNDNGIIVVNFAASNNLTIKRTNFPHRKIHKCTWTSPDRKIHKDMAFKCT